MDGSGPSSSIQSECLSVTHHVSAMSKMLDYITALATGCFLKQAGRTAVLPIGGRLHTAQGTWRLISTSKYVLSVVDHGFSIKWDGELPKVPHDGRNPPATEDSKVILDNEVVNMLKKNVIRLADTSVDGVISGYLSRPKKAEGKFRPIVSLKYTNCQTPGSPESGWLYIRLVVCGLFGWLSGR